MRTLAIALILLSAAPAMAMAPMRPRPVAWTCESADAFQKLGQAAALRGQKQFPQATAQIALLSPADRANRHAQYASALIAIDQNATGSPALTAAVTDLARMADAMPDYVQLSPPQRACAETAKLYSVFNTLGVEYTQLGDRAAAERYFLRGEANAAALAPDSRSKLEYNLGIFYTGQLDLKKASYHYGLAKTPAALTQQHVLEKAQSFAPVQAQAPRN
ncbi:MAG: hypothetical protein ACREHE_03515 [Rhizomicrobium sp.]